MQLVHALTHGTKATRILFAPVWPNHVGKVNVFVVKLQLLTQLATWSLWTSGQFPDEFKKDSRYLKETRGELGEGLERGRYSSARGCAAHEDEWRG